MVHFRTSERETTPCVMEDIWKGIFRTLFGMSMLEFIVGIWILPARWKGNLSYPITQHGEFDQHQT